ncbi:MAG: aminotransferase class I/II-fold pyridoxal phosphate-dependent enzyme [Crocinitomix sp.]|nr:aminotransferase class I/II-fold pyridoxal phosphate-dependent enzyme [Crocinitomix sp.]
MSKRNNEYPELINTIYESINHGVRKGVLHLTADYSREFVLNVKGINTINFSSYSYLGLENHPQLVDGGKKALDNYGTQFGYSRAFLSLNIYNQLEKSLGEIFKNEVLVAPSTTLAHQAVLPVLINQNDLVIVDQHAHASIHYAVKPLKEKNIRVELIRHNRIDLIEEKILKNRQNVGRIWYLADGIYSMYGDLAPVKELEKLMNKYDQFYTYVDDAHGMSWTGTNGKGYVLSEIDLHNQMVLVTSLNKSFCGAGGAIVLPNQQWKDKIRTCGGPLIFSTPIPPPMLGIGCSSAELHLSEEFIEIQEEVRKNIVYCNEELARLGIAEISKSHSPIFYIPTSYPKLSYNLAERMLNKGFFVTPAVFPAVSARKAGIRICISAKHSFHEITEMLECLLGEYQAALNEEKINFDNILTSFNLEMESYNSMKNRQESKKKSSRKLRIEKFQTVEELNREEWDSIFSTQGNFDYNGLKFLEKSYSNKTLDKENWGFHYLIIRDVKHKIVAATFLTVSLCKDDMFKPYEISKEIELARRSNPFYLCSKALMMGSTMTEGNHLFIDDNNVQSNEALKLLLDEIVKLSVELDVDNVYLRDFKQLEKGRHDIFIENGFVRIEIPDFAHELDLSKIKSIDDLLHSLTSKKRQQIKKDVIYNFDKFKISVNQYVDPKELAKYYDLYLSVKRKSFLINTFDINYETFQEMNLSQDWEFIVLHLNSEKNSIADSKQPVGVVFCYRNTSVYVPLFVGLDYDYLHSHKNYKQSIFQVVKRAIELGKDSVNFGFTATTEKKRIGAKPAKKYAYVQITDSYNMDILEYSNEHLMQL